MLLRISRGSCTAQELWRQHEQPSSLAINCTVN